MKGVYLVDPMSSILVDYENVQMNGMIGIELLTDHDRLDLFYSNSSKTIRKDIISIILKSGCRFTAIKLVDTGKDYLDRYIAVRTGELYARGEREIAIISKDKGYKAVQDSFAAMKYEDSAIVRTDTIESALTHFSNPSDGQRRRIIQARWHKEDLDVIVQKLEKKKVITNSIYSSLEKTEFEDAIDQIVDYCCSFSSLSRKQLYTGLLHMFGKESGLELYRLIGREKLVFQYLS